MKILHLIKNPHDSYAADIAARQQRAGHEVALLLLHDAVYDAMGVKPLSQQGIAVYACADDVQARGPSAPPFDPAQDELRTGIASQAGLLDYEGIVTLMFAYDKVVCW
jgi:sulfur relay protein TusB/DsrH